MASIGMQSGARAYGMGLLLFFLVLLAPLAVATQFKVGGSAGWAVPIDPNAESYNQWASRMRFRIGDSLLFVYPADKDSVIEVTKEDYDACKATTPVARFSDGNTIYTFTHSGPHYFISGVEDNCHKNEKMVVVVMADRSKPRLSTPPPPPSPTLSSPPSTPSTNPPPPPASSPPPPKSESTPSPPPSGEESNPSSPPPPPPNAASVEVLSGMSLFAASLGLFMFVF